MTGTKFRAPALARGNYTWEIVPVSKFGTDDLLPTGTFVGSAGITANVPVAAAQIKLLTLNKRHAVTCQNLTVK